MEQGCQTGAGPEPAKQSLHWTVLESERNDFELEPAFPIDKDLPHRHSFHTIVAQYYTHLNINTEMFILILYNY